jgi:hypothetical protein
LGDGDPRPGRKQAEDDRLMRVKAALMEIATVFSMSFSCID